MEVFPGSAEDGLRIEFFGDQIERITQFDPLTGGKLAGVEAVSSSVSCGAVDEAARGVLRQAGLAEAFSHSTGHGVGLEIHEPPRIGAGQTNTLHPGMVVTIEPGVYLAGQFGIRIEDMVAVTGLEARCSHRRPKRSLNSEVVNTELAYRAARLGKQRASL